MINYFVSFAIIVPGRTNGFGNYEVNASRPIRGFDDISHICEQLKEKIQSKYDSNEAIDVIILNWKRFEK